MFTKKRLLTAGLLLLIVGTVWLFYPDPRLAKARALQQELSGAAGKQLSAEQRQQKWREFREVTKGLTSAQRRQLSGEGRKEKQREIASYFRMPPREKTQFLDAQIRREQQMQQKMQARGGAPKGRGSGGSARVGKRSEQERDQQRQKLLDRSSPAERAMMNQFRKDLTARRNQLRLPAPRGFGPPR